MSFPFPTVSEHKYHFMKSWPKYEIADDSFESLCPFRNFLDVTVSQSLFCFLKTLTVLKSNDKAVCGLSPDCNWDLSDVSLLIIVSLWVL